MNIDEMVSAFEHLQAACRVLEEQGEHDIAAITSHAMSLIIERHSVGADHMDDRAS